MVHLAHTLPFFGLITIIVLDTLTVTAVPVSFNQAVIRHPPRVTYVKPNQEIAPPMPPRVIIKMKPASLSAFRGSRLASRQIAEAKGDQIHSGRVKRGQSLVYASYGSDTASSGWMLDQGPPSGEELFAESGDEIMKYSDEQSSESSDPPLPAQSTAADPKATSSSSNTKSVTESFTNGSNASQQDMDKFKGSTISSVAPPVASVNIDLSNPQVLSRVSIVNRLTRAKENEIKQRILTGPITIKDSRRRSREVLAQSKLLRDARTKVKARSNHIPQMSDAARSFQRQSEFRSRGSRPDHRRRLANQPLSEGLTGQLAILSPLEGTKSSQRVSQLIAHLVLAPLAPSPQGEVAPDHSAPRNEQSTGDTHGNSFLLAPDSSKTGIKLQMVEVEPSHNEMMEEKWKYVQFQAMLNISADKKPQLYCAVMQQSNSLHMDSCDQSSFKVSADRNEQTSKIFLYDTSTGEVVPSHSLIDDDEVETGSGDQAVAKALAQLSAGTSKGAMSSSTEKRQNLALQKVKLIFVVERKDQTTGTSHINHAEISLDDADIPPLLKHEHSS